MSIQISSQRGKIGLNIKNAKMNMTTEEGKMNIRQKSAKLKIKQDHAQVIIDQYQCFAEAGLKNNTDLTTDMVNLSKQAVLRGIERIAQDGDRLAMIGNRMPNAIPELAKKNTTEEKQFGFTMIPKSRPKIDFKGGLEINWELGGVEANYTPSKINYQYIPGKVETYMKKWPELDIKFIDDKI